MLTSSNNIGGLARFEEVGMETIRAHTHTHIKRIHINTNNNRSCAFRAKDG